jgi:hypothetical protein
MHIYIYISKDKRARNSDAPDKNSWSYDRAEVFRKDPAKEGQKLL